MRDGHSDRKDNPTTQPPAPSAAATRMGPLPQDTDWRNALWTPQVEAAALGSFTTIASFILYVHFKRIPNAESVRSSSLVRKRWVKGIVTSVGDADNFRMYHTPGVFWRAPLKLRRIPDTRKELQNQTIHIRLAGIDAPEAAHFGRPSQPYSAEALAWLTSYIGGKRVYCQLLRRDQYGRIIANVHLPPRLFPSSLATGANVSTQMLRAGWGTTYVQGGAEYGMVGKDKFLQIEHEAKAARRGMWVKGVTNETPAEYKKRFKSLEAATVYNTTTGNPKPTTSWFSNWRWRVW